MWQVFYDALTGALQWVADIISALLSYVFAPVISALQSIKATVEPYYNWASGAGAATLPYLNAAEQWFPVYFVLFLIGAYFAIAGAFLVYKLVMKIVPHFGG